MDLFAAWKGIREQLFDPRTNLFYDYTTSHDRAQKFRYICPRRKRWRRISPIRAAGEPAWRTAC